MTVRLQLRPEIEAELLAQARSHGVSLEAYLEQLLHERGPTVMPPNISAADKASTFESWARGHSRTPPLLDQAVRRENLVRDAR